MNLTNKPQDALLTVSWQQLSSGAKIAAWDAMSKEPVEVDGERITVTVEMLNFRLLRVK